MALRTVTKSNAGNLIYTSKMQTGEKIEGYFMGTKAGVTKNPKWKAPLVLVFQTEDGRTIDAYASGSLAYVEENAVKDPTQALVVGQYTVITKTGSYKNKQDRDFPTFMIQQDDSKNLMTAVSSSEVSSNTVQDRLARVRQ